MITDFYLELIETSSNTLAKAPVSQPIYKTLYEITNHIITL